MHVAIITAGGAGMFCGSCMHDNAWARALQTNGTEISLIPLYTPLKLDEQSVAEQQVFLGGINVYLNTRYRWWRALPRFLQRWVDRPRVIQWATGFGISNDARELGELTLATLAGTEGPLKNAIDELASHIAALKPDVVCFSNLMIAVALRSLRTSFPGPLVGILQGDDLFLDSLVEPYRSQAVGLMQKHIGVFDRLVTHSAYYRDYMANYLQFDPGRCALLPLAIDSTPHHGLPRPRDHRPPTVGYFARIAPEKGLHHLVDAMLLLQQEIPDVHLMAAGHLSKQHHGYFQELQLKAQPLGARFRYHGSPATQAEKSAFLQKCHLLSVPAPYHEPKGLYVLEANANGIPVVQPRHGAFPELILSTGGGSLVDPDDPRALAEGLKHLLLNEPVRLQLATNGHRNVRANHDTTTLARKSVLLFEELLNPSSPAHTRTPAASLP